MWEGKLNMNFAFKFIISNSLITRSLEPHDIIKYDKVSHFHLKTEKDPSYPRPV